MRAPEVIDTNVVRSAAEGDLDGMVLAELRARSADLHLSPISVLEIARHVRAAKADELPRYQRALVAARDLCGSRILPLPHVLARKILFGDEEASDPPRFFEAWRDIMISASDLDDLARPEIVDIDGRPHEVTLRLDAADKLLLGIEATWTDDAERVSQEVLATLPGVNADRSSGRLVIKNASERERARDVLRGEEMRRFIAKALLGRLASSIDEMRAAMTDEDLVTRTMKTFDLYIRYYLSIVEDRLTSRSGYNFAKKNHDRLDLEFLLYVGAGYGLVTMDGPILHRTRMLGAADRVRDVRSTSS